MIEEEVIGSHTDDDQEDTQLSDVFKAFDIEPQEEKEEISVNDKTPAKEDVKTEPRIEKVKHNKEETDVDISTTEKLHDHLQRSLALDKERDRVKQSQNDLDRAAKLLGYKDHAELSVNLDRIEQKQIQDEKDKFQQLKQQIYDELVDAGTSEEVARAYVDNNPLVQQANQALTEREQVELERQNQKSLQENISKWQTMYSDPRVLAAFPDIIEDSKAIDQGETPKFFTPEMQSRIDRGYDPLDAILLAHADKFQGQSKRATEQRLIKEQQLGLRSRVETNTAPNNEPQVPAELASAFAAFGLPAESAKKYIKK